MSHRLPRLRLVVVLVVIGLLSAPAIAQQRRGPDPEKRVAHLTEQLGLDADQQAKLRPILEEEGRDLKAAFDDARASGKKGGMREIAKPIRERTDARIEALLKDEQKERFQALRKEQRERMERRHMGGGGGKGKPKSE